LACESVRGCLEITAPTLSHHVKELEKLTSFSSVRNSWAARLFERDLLAEFFFEGFTFLGQEIAKNHFGTLFDETSDDSFSDSSGTAGNDGNLIVSPESDCRDYLISLIRTWFDDASSPKQTPYGTCYYNDAMANITQWRRIIRCNGPCADHFLAERFHGRINEQVLA
jgi:hypothetical protein